MITVTRLDQTAFILNADLIELVESKPDTYLTLVTGKKLVVCETPREIVERVIAFRRQAGAFPRLPLAGVRVGEEITEDEDE